MLDPPSGMYFIATERCTLKFSTLVYFSLIFSNYTEDLTDWLTILGLEILFLIFLSPFTFIITPAISGHSGNSIFSFKPIYYSNPYLPSSPYYGNREIDILSILQELAFSPQSFWESKLRYNSLRRTNIRLGLGFCDINIFEILSIILRSS